MSSQRGNCAKSGPQKHKNTTAYRNDLHRKKDRTMKILNSLQIVGCCKRCKEVIEWKIKYNKYKHLARPKKCVKCLQKSVTNSYYIICQNCIESQNLCGKCASVPPVDLPPAENSDSVASEINTKSRIVSDKKKPEEEDDDSDYDEDDSELDNEVEKVLTINDNAENQVSIKHIQAKKKDGAKNKSSVRQNSPAKQKVTFEDSTSEDESEDDETPFSVDCKKSKDKDKLNVDKGKSDEDKGKLDEDKDKLDKVEDKADRNKLSSSVKKGEDVESELDEDEDDDDEDGDDDDGGDEAEDEDDN